MRKIVKNITVYSLGILYIIIGIKHFTDLDFFLVIVPPYIPFPKLAVYISGIFEIIFGILIVPKRTRKYSAIGLFFLLIAVFPANVHLYNSETAQKIYGITKNDALIRLPFQIPLLVMAYWHSIQKSNVFFDTLSIVIFIPTIIYFLSLG